MATVRVYTAERMQEIEDSAVVGGLVVGDDLVLTRRDGQTIAAGNVRGATGAQGPIGEPVVTGAVAMWIFDNLPSGWLSLDGQAITNANTLYPALWAASPSSWKSGTTLTLPNMKGRIPVHLDTSQTEFDTTGKIGGNKSTTLSTANIPAHIHTLPEVTLNVANDFQFMYAGSVNVQTGATPITTLFGSGSESQRLKASIPPGSNTTSVGQTQAFSNLQPFYVVRFIIKT